MPQARARACVPLSISSTDSGKSRLEIGRIVRPHGLRGEVVVDAVSNRPERFIPGAVLYAGDRPLVLKAARLHKGRWLVAFEGVVDRGGLEALRDATLTGDMPEALPDGEFWVHELIGSEAEDQGGQALGRVVSVEANPASDLLVLEDGGLVPVRFVRSFNSGRVVVDIPPGLLDL